ncbi:DgyrCDS2265 [Dimorphilus gyrociliatus]|uniref:DgyrCDS2265 n=1 Tax=Dimorphilus gyrociliatus TaxID=2664684 RepID=A0A7I8V9Y3_9ANNE|nr:DgyrCDS2265 [Dimorphilus gyrociliatus]
MANKPGSAKGERFAPYLKRKTHPNEKIEQKNETHRREFGNTFDESITVPTVAQSGYEEQPEMPDTTGSEIIQEQGDPIPTMPSQTDDSQQRTLYVGNLDPHVTEDLLLALFSQITPCRGCKIIYEPGNDPYAFIDFEEHSGASAALQAMNKIQVLGRVSCQFIFRNEVSSSKIKKTNYEVH